VIALHSDVWAMAGWDSEQIATNTANSLISNPFMANAARSWKMPVLRGARG
jgi:hypothetical protein